LTSSSPRAVDSVNVLSEYLNISFEELSLFNSDIAVSLMPAFEFLVKKSNEADVIILVSHLEYCEMLPLMFQKRVMNVEPDKRFVFNKRDVCVLDFQAKTILML